MPKRHTAPSVRHHSSPAVDLKIQLDLRTCELAEARKQLTEALEQQTASSEVLGIISSSLGDVQSVFQAMLANAIRLCDANFGVLHRFGNGKFLMAAGLNTPSQLAEFNRKRGWFTPFQKAFSVRL